MLYVAVTRAKKRLYLFGHVSKFDGDEFKVENKSLLSSLEHIIKPEMIREVSEEEDKEDDLGDENSLPLKRLPLSWEMPEPCKALEVKVEEKADVASVEKPEFLWAGETIKHMGTVIHSYLCRIAREGIKLWSTERAGTEKGHLAAMLRKHGLSRADADLMALEGIDLLCKTVEDSRGRWILGPQMEAESEMPISAVIDGKVVHRVIDRTFVDEGGVRWIIDYKISRHKGGDSTDFLINEKERYRGQLEEYASLLALAGEKRRIKKGLYYPAMSEWIEW